MTTFNELPDALKQQVTDLISKQTHPVEIRRFVKQFGYDMTISDIASVQVSVTDFSPPKLVSPDRLPVLINVESVANDLNLHLKTDDVTKIIANTQTLTSQIFTLEAIIRYALLKQYIDGSVNYPEHTIQGYTAAYRVMSDALAIQNHVNPNAAINTLKSLGYAIKSLEQ